VGAGDPSVDMEIVCLRLIDQSYAQDRTIPRDREPQRQQKPCFQDEKAFI
jgi:hypothetical protein